MRKILTILFALATAVCFGQNPKDFHGTWRIGKFYLGDSTTRAHGLYSLRVDANGLVTRWDTTTADASVAGSDREIQYNNSGAFGASSNFKYNSSGEVLIGTTDKGASKFQVEGNMFLGNYTGTVTATPEIFNMGGKVSDDYTDPAKLKLKLFDNGSGAVSGIGVANDGGARVVSYFSDGSGARHTFYANGTNSVNISSTGINLPTLTATTPLKLDASKNIVSAAIDLATSNVTGLLPIANGGTNASTASAARINLLPSMSGNSLKVLRVNSGETDYELTSNYLSSSSTINNTSAPTADFSMASHKITNVSDGTSGNDAINKNQLDAVVAPQHYKEARGYVTIASLPTNTYNNGAGTLTAVLTGTLTIDGHLMVINETALIKDEADATHNGPYKVTVAGAVGVAYVLTRGTDMDASSEFTNKDAIFIGDADAANTTLENTTWVYNGITSPTLGTDNLTFVQINNTNISDNSVTNAKLAQAAQNTIKGNNTGGTANVADLTVSQVKTLLSVDLVTNESKATMFTSPTLTGTPVLGAATGTSLILSSFLNEAKGTDIASASTTDIGAATGNYLDVTGTVTITALGTVQAGTRRVVRFTGALTLTHNATSLILPGGANITTVAGDVAMFISLGSGNWRCVNYMPATVQGTGATVLANSPNLTTPDITTGFKIGGAAASGKIPIGNGTNYIASTPAYPNASVTSRKIIVSNGTDYTASTELWPVPTATVGTHMVGNGTDWTAVNERTNWTSFSVSGSDFTTTSTSLVDITGLVSGTLSTATLYEFEAVLYVNSTSTAGIAVGVQQSGTGSGQIGVWTGTSTNAAATGLAIGSNALNTAGAACVLVNGDGSISVKGFVKTGSSGSPTISLKVLKATSGTAKVYIGSKLLIRQAN